jgi:hypothetical protein
MAREHPIDPHSFAACKTHLSTALADFMVERNAGVLRVRITRLNRIASQTPDFTCTCRKPATFLVQLIPGG